MSSDEKSPGLAKLSAPRLVGVLPRERLFARLDQCLVEQALWVSGPAGAGKTVLVASYLNQRAHAAIWYQVDKGDADPAACCDYLQRAAADGAPQAAALLPRVPAAARGRDLTLSLQAFFRAFYGLFAARRYLVIDNAQEALGAGDFRKLLLVALGEAPRHCRLIVISRIPPPKEFARLQANGELLVFDRNELLLTEDESFAVQRLAVADGRAGYSEAQMRRRHELAQGWAAGLKLLLQVDDLEVIHLRDRLDVGGTALFDYLAAEIFDRQSAAVRDCLLKIAHLPHATIDMADALCGGTGAAHILGRMQADGLLISASGAGPTSGYTFHPLLRHFLLQRARKEFSGGKLSAIERRAAALLAEHGEWDAAAQVLMAGRLASDLPCFVKQHASKLIERGWHRTLAVWLAALPEAQVRRDAWLSYWQGQAVAPFDPPAGDAHFERAYRLFRRQGVGDGAVLAWCSIVDLICLEWADFRSLDHWLDEAESLREHAVSDPALALRFAASFVGALHFGRPHDPAMHTSAEDLLRRIETCPDGNQRIFLGCNLGIHYTVGVGRKQELDRLMAAVVPPPNAVLTPMASTLLCALESMYAWRYGRNEQAAANAQSGLQLAHQCGLRTWDFILAALEFYSRLTSGDSRRANLLLKRLEKLLDRRRKVDVAHFYYLACLGSLFAGDGDTALVHIETANATADRYGGSVQHALGRLAQACALHALGRTLEARAFLGRARAIAQSMHSAIIIYEADLCAALFALDQGDEEGCAAALENAFRVGLVEDYLNHHHFVPEVMARLCAFALEHAIVPQFARRLIRERRLKPPFPDVSCWPWPVKVFCLGRFVVLVDEQSVGAAGSAQHKPFELLQAILAFGGRQVAIERLIQHCWPSSECRDGRGAFDANLSRLRKILGDDDSVLITGGRVSLNDALCWVDAWAFGRLLGRARTAFADVVPETTPRLLERANRLLDLYQGDFLEREQRVAWAGQQRGRLRSGLVETLSETARRLEERGETRAAAGIYRRAIDIDPLLEASYRHLMACLHQLGERTEALRVYARCRDVLQTNLRTIPSKATEAIRAAL